MESNNKDRAYTYGSARFEILGGLINCVFLIATAAYVIVEAIPALIWSEEFRGSTMLIITSAIGFLINLFATVFFGGHHHGHSHGGHSHEEPAKKHGHDNHGHSEKSHGNVNSYAVFIHFLGDALSSLCVMFGGILAYIFPSASWIGYVDPVASLIIVAIMVGSAIPVLRTCCKIVLQKAPQHIDVLELEDNIASSDKRIKSVKDLRVWQMSHEKLVCSVRVKLVQGLSLNDVSQVVEGIRAFLKEENNIDDVTVEPIVKNA
jgi:zinc transporter 1